MQKESVEQNTLLFEAILALRDQEECRAFFQDLCTVAELKALAPPPRPFDFKVN